MRQILLAALLCALAFSCTQKPENYKYRPDIEADFEVEIVPSDETLVLSDIVDGYKLIEPKDVLFGYVFKALRYDSLLIVSGMTDDDGLLHLFDTDGNFEEVIIRKGQGPEEATGITEWKLFGDDIYLLTDIGRKLMRYSLKERKLVDSFNLPEEIGGATCSFEVLGNEKYIFYKNQTCSYKGEAWAQADEYKLYVYDKTKDEITHRWIPLHKKSTEYISIGQSDCLYQCNGKCYFHEVFQKGIYEVNADTLQGYISFKDNKYTMDTDVLYGAFQTFDEFMNYCFDNSYIWADRDFFEGKHFIMGNYQSGKTFYGCLIGQTTEDKPLFSARKGRRFAGCRAAGNKILSEECAGRCVLLCSALRTAARSDGSQERERRAGGICQASPRCDATV